MIRVLLVSLLFLVLSVTIAQPYTECPVIDGIEVTSEWVEYHDSLSHEWFFSQYRRYFKFFTIDGVDMASQGSYDNNTILVYAGWYWDKPDGVYHNGHPSCGVWLMEGNDANI